MAADAERVDRHGKGGAKADGAGLSGLADRAASVGGVSQVNSPRGGGGRVTAQIPLR